MNDLIRALIEDETASNLTDAIEIINCMKQEIKDGEDIEDVLSQYGLELDYAIDLLQQDYCQRSIVTGFLHLFAQRIF